MITELVKTVPLYDGRKVTRDEYLSLPDDGFHYDMIDGVLHLSPSPFSEHSDYSANFIYLVKSYTAAKKTAKVFSELDVHLPDGGDIVRPDITVVLNENSKIIDKWIFGAPDLVCEVLSESTRGYDLGRKAERYLSNGVKEFWIIDPDSMSIQVWKNRKTEWEKEGSAELFSEVLVGFSFRVSEFFE